MIPNVGAGSLSALQQKPRETVDITSSCFILFFQNKNQLTAFNHLINSTFTMYLVH